MTSKLTGLCSRCTSASTTTSHSPIGSEGSHQENKEGQGSWAGKHHRRHPAGQWRPSSRPSPTSTTDFYPKAVSLALGRLQTLSYSARKVIRPTIRIPARLAFSSPSTRYSPTSSCGECFIHWTTTSQGSVLASGQDTLSSIASRPSASS